MPSICTFSLQIAPCGRCRTTAAIGGSHALAWALAAGFGRLGRICTKQSVFEWSAIEAANDRVHLFLIWGFDESETLRFLSFGIADYLDHVCDQAF